MNEIGTPAEEYKMADKIDILHLEDDPYDAQLVQAKLEEAGMACRITRVQSRDEFEDALGRPDLDIILADYRLPMYDGLSALHLVARRRPDIPFIFVSGTIGEEAAIEALTKGATDYVLKQSLMRIGPAVQRALREAHNQSERRQAEKSLAQSEAMMRGILNSVDEGFVVIDRQYRIRSANRAYCSLVNLREEEVIGRQCHAILRQNNQPCYESGLECPVQHTFRTGTAHACFITHQAASGALLYLELKSYPISDASGTIVSVIETINDVTEKYQLQEQLAHSQKMESVARLAGGVAHDFNNMLGVIIGHAELAMGRVDTAEPLLGNLREIRKAAGRSAALTRQLLAFARKQTVAPRVLDLNETVSGMLNMLRPLIGEDIDLVWRPGKGASPVKMDPSQIDQILVNLCVNARDAITGIGRITIETDLITFDPDYCRHHPEIVAGDYVSLIISDDGCGMEPEILGAIFDPFFTTKDIGRGTGLGLATVYGIIKQNDGFIKVHSEPGQGTTFKLYLPRYLDEAVHVRHQEREAQIPVGHETILLVEDESLILSMTTLMLEKLGYQVLSASTPADAMRVTSAHEGEIRLLIVDVIMPEMNGRDLANQVAAHQPAMGCLFMSGYSGDIIANHGILEEGVHFIQKPFSMESLAVKVRQVLDGD